MRGARVVSGTKFLPLNRSPSLLKVPRGHGAKDAVVAHALIDRLVYKINTILPANWKDFEPVSFSIDDEPVCSWTVLTCRSRLPRAR